ncbi:MAG TPA: NAD(+)/NADH kinase [Candidatus Eisenbacteria bacterium]|nr:NAD(+)/NADH kinase [Candidatus Eisenbacteria bacterium]
MSRPAAVGLIVNPAAGRDIRRLVGAASVMPHHEKAAILRRVLRGLEAAGIEHVLYLPDGAGIVAAAADVPGLGLRLESLPIRPQGFAGDSIEAARLLAALGAAAIVTLGGDGTNRAVATGCGRVPLVAVSTGTNNVFPSMVEGTIAGLAAGLVASGAVPADEAAPGAKWVEVVAGDVSDVALVDVAACRDSFKGAAAIWDPARVRAIVLSRAEPWAVGLSSIGGRLRPLAHDEPGGLYVELGDAASGDPTVRAVLAPGLTADVAVRECRPLALGEEVVLPAGRGIVALDGERELPCRGRVTARVTAGGPRLVDVRRVLALAAGAGLTRAAR